MLHPGLSRFLDFPDVAASPHPGRCLFNGGLDPLFPADGVHVAYDGCAPSGGPATPRSGRT